MPIGEMPEQTSGMLCAEVTDLQGFEEKREVFEERAVLVAGYRGSL
jgi:hypothetical protein